jgi:carboxypeptidase Q
MSAAWTKPSAWLAANGLENVHVEPTVLPYWRRGEQSATLLSPRRTPLTMLGLGGSIGTQQYGSQGLTAEVIVVSSFDELTAKAAQAKGKIVVFNQQCDWKAQPVDCYGESVSYRTQGWLAVSAVGGVASLIRSVASFSIDSPPHTGSTSRSTAYPPIPTTALTVVRRGGCCDVGADASTGAVNQDQSQFGSRDGVRVRRITRKRQ